jgi:hypothetical protein
MGYFAKLLAIHEKLYESLIDNSKTFGGILDSFEMTTFWTDISFFGSKEKNLQRAGIDSMTALDKKLLFFCLCHNYGLKLYVRLNQPNEPRTEGGEEYSQNPLMKICAKLISDSDKKHRKIFEKTYDELHSIAERLVAYRKDLIERIQSLREQSSYHRKALKIEKVNLQCNIKQHYILALSFHSGGEFKFLYKDVKDKNTLHPIYGADKFKTDTMIATLTKLLNDNVRAKKSVAKITPKALNFEQGSEEGLTMNIALCIINKLAYI